MRISDWSSDVCSSDLGRVEAGGLRTVCRVHVSKSEPADLRAAKWKARREAGPSFSAIPPPAYETRAPIAATLSVVPSVPVAGLALILGIDRFIDRKSTRLNSSH